MTIGVVIVPALNLLATEHSEFVQVTVVVPLIVFVFGLLYLSENRAMMRCGCYIRTHIEPKFAELSADINHISGWENWLESDETEFPYKRLVDVISAMSFFTLFIVYYIGSSYLAADYIRGNFTKTVTILAIAIYVLFGLGFLIILGVNRGLITRTTYNKIPSGSNPARPVGVRKQL